MIMGNQQAIIQKMRRFSLLFIEDFDPLRVRMVKMLEEYFYRVDGAADGVEGLEKYKEYYRSSQKYYDLVISDIQMPKMNGVELTEQIRAIRENQPIIILSAYTEAEYLLSLINIGVSQFITKPVQYPQMFDTLYKVCNKIDMDPLIIESLKHIVNLSDVTIWDKEKKLLLENTTAIVLTKYEIHLMDILVAKFDQVCSSEDILNHFYLNSIDISSESLRGMMMRLRKKLPDNVLTSIYGIGYRLSSR